MKNTTNTPGYKFLKLNHNSQNSLIFNTTKNIDNLPEILFITTYPPRECGIATYSQDLITAIATKFKEAFKIVIAAVQVSADKYNYSSKVNYILETDNQNSYLKLAQQINDNQDIQLVVIEHE